jgi:NitT/TauT family transport system permease protein
MNDIHLKWNTWRFLQFLLPFIVVIVLWEIVATVFDISQLPPPSEVFGRFYEMAFVDGVLWNNVGASLYRLLVGYLLAVMGGMAVGFLVGMNKDLSDAISPSLSLLISIPTIAWVPVLLMTLGLGDQAVIAAVFLGGFFAIAYSTIHGVRMVDKNLVNAARTMGSGNWALFSQVYAPGSMASLLPGLRLAVGYSWRALIGAEMLAAMIRWGLGKMIYDASFWNDVQTMFVGLVMMGVIGLIMDKVLLSYLERITLERWGVVETAQEASNA